MSERATALSERAAPQTSQRRGRATVAPSRAAYGSSLPPGTVAALQRAIGNQAVAQILVQRAADGTVLQRATELETRLAAFKKSLDAVNTKEDLYKLMEGAGVGMDYAVNAPHVMDDLQSCSGTTQLVVWTILGKDAEVYEKYAKDKQDYTISTGNIAKLSGALGGKGESVAILNQDGGDHVLTMFKTADGTVQVYQGWIGYFSIAESLNKEGKAPGNFNHVLQGGDLDDFLNTITGRNSGKFTLENALGQKRLVSTSWKCSVNDLSAFGPKQKVPESDKKKGKRCYITSACVRARGLPDDCAELTTLRAFRDGFLAAHECGPVLLDLYYRYAPAIVAAIDAQRDAASVYRQLYRVVAACADDVRENRPEAALRTYAEMVVGLNAQYLAGRPIAPARVRQQGP